MSIKKSFKQIIIIIDKLKDYLVIFYTKLFKMIHTKNKKEHKIILTLIALEWVSMGFNCYYKVRY